MKIKKLSHLILFILVMLCAAGGFVAYRSYTKANSGGLAPVIFYETDVIYAKVGVTDEELLAGMTASDDKDGDVTDSLVVEGISQFVDKNTCVVTYAAFDSSDNVGKATRTLVYTDYHPPRFELSQPMSFKYDININILGHITAWDCIDGDVTKKIKVTIESDVMSIYEPGIYDLRFRVTNSMGDTSYLPLNLEIKDASYSVPASAPKTKLSKYLEYLEVGEGFDPLSYVRSVSIDNTEVNPYMYGRNNIEVRSSVNTEVPGVYTVEYITTSKDGYRYSVPLIVVVGPGTEVYE